METVISFNTELSGLYESKPPISKAKMTSITRSAMKAIKFYKHVVQSVEKFILKCKQEYKIPGLYVIDSIVRQSRHQFGTEKDVFAPRFARNMQTTFANLFQCSPEDKSKIIRVLNLWQKNSVFAPEVIQPLFDLANPNHPIYQNQNANQEGGNMSNGILGSSAQDSPPNDEGHTMSSDMSGPILPNTSQLDSSTIRQLQQLQQLLIRQTNSEPVASTSGSGAADSVKFNKKLLDYDYGDDEDDDKTSPRQSQQQALDNSNITQLLNDPNVLRQLQNLQKLKQQEEKNSKLAEMRMQEEAFEKHLATVLKKLPFANECDLSRQDRNDTIFGLQTANLSSLLQQQQAAGGLGGIIGTNTTDQHDPEVELVSDDGKVEIINLDGNSRSPSIDRDRYKRRRSRSRSRDRGMNRDRRRRSRSRSPRSRRRITSRDMDRERERERGKEKDRERKRKGLPEIKREMLSVCSTTLWIGHLSKLVQQEELSDTFGKYGEIVTIDMIIPRGCAFIAMHRRQDAYKAIDALKNHKLGGRAITISWAPGKGVKSKEWKEYWDLETGVSYIPWSKLDDSTDFEALEEGGMIDEESAPNWLTEKLKAETQKKEQRKNAIDIPQMPNMGLFGLPGSGLADTSQPPPTAMPPMMATAPPMVPAFAHQMPPRFMGPMGMPIPQNLSMPLGVPPPMNGQLMMPSGMVPGMPMKNMPPGANSGPFIGYFPPMPQMPPIPQNTSTASNNDDHMDIEMEDETKPIPNNINNQPNLINPLNLFNRPPPQMFPQGIPPLVGNVPPTFDNQPPIAADMFSDSEGRPIDDHAGGIRDRNSNDRERDFGRGRERDQQGGRGGNRDRRGEAKNLSGPHFSCNTRVGMVLHQKSPDRQQASGILPFSPHRSRSRDEFSRTGGKNNNRERGSSRDKSLQDRLRDLAGAPGRNDPNARGGNPPWPSIQPPGFPGNNVIDLAGSRRNVGMSGPPPALEDLDIPVPIEAIRSTLGGKGRFKNDFNRGGNNDFDRRGGGLAGREFYGGRFGGPPGINNGPPPMGGSTRGGNFGPRNSSPMFPGSGMWNRNAGTNPTDRFFDRDGSGNGGGDRENQSVKTSGGFHNSGFPFSQQTNSDNRRAGGSRQNKNRGSSEDNGETNQKSSRWGNASPKSEDHWDNSPPKKLPNNTNNKKQSANNRNRNDSSGPNESQPENTTTEDNSRTKSCEFLNDPSNPDAMPVRPIRLPKEQKATTPSKTNDSNDGEATGNIDTESVVTNSSDDRTVKVTHENVSDTNSSYPCDEPPKPPRRPKDVNTSHSQPPQETQSSVTENELVSATVAPTPADTISTPTPTAITNTNNFNDNASTEKSTPVTPSAAAVPSLADSAPQSNENSDCVISEPTTATE